MSSLVVHGFSNFNGAQEDTPLITPGKFTRPYIASKVKCEQLLESYRKQLEVVVIRPGFQIYGPNDVLTTREILDRLEKGKFPGLVNGGNNKLGYVYVDNLVYGLQCAGTHPNAAGNTYIISNYDPPYTTLKNVINKYSEKLGVTTRLASFPAWLLMPVAFLIDAVHYLFMKNRMPIISTYIINTGSHNIYFKPDKAIREIGYKQIVSFEESIDHTIAWYKALKSNLKN
jgi:nucleoside-diphosphate-sugar epimerase